MHLLYAAFFVVVLVGSSTSVHLILRLNWRTIFAALRGEWGA